ncbi:hypothetical protein JW921_00755 [Candidatus Fermentibacterales bacterium]|nr:hypothetical protein [Candidatus Fermentibacterales bacterium]
MAPDNDSKAGKGSLWKALDAIDRRWIFLLMALAVFLPLALKLSFPIPVGEGPSKNLFDYIDSLPEGSVVLMSFDYDPSTMPELQPMTVALLQHLFTKGIAVVGMGLWPQGVSLGQQALSDVADSLGAEQYVDWVNLGYKTGGGILIVRMGSSVGAAFPADRDGVPIAEVPLMQGIGRLADFDLILSLSAGDPGIPAWVMMAGDRFGVPIGGGCTAVSAPQFYPYLGSGQMVGLLGGLKGAADYETLVRQGVEDAAPGTATPGMAAQSIAHLVIMGFIVIGNIAFIAGRRARGGGVPG